MPSISVIMPIYNAKEYLTGAINSVLSQSVSLEIIAVDDGSTDGSRELLSRLAETDRRIKAYYNNDNRGVAAVRNFALLMSRGKYLAFCDADDLVPEGAYAKLLSAVKGFDVAIGAYRNAYGDGSITPPIKVDRTERSTPFCSLLSVGCLWTKLISRSFVIKNRILFDASARIGEDVIFLSELAMHDPLCAFTNTVVYHHIHHDTAKHRSLTHTYTYSAFLLHLRTRERILKLCGQEHIGYVYRHFTPFLSDFIFLMPEGDERREAFRLFKKHLSKFDFHKCPELFFAVVGVDINGFEQMDDAEFVEERNFTAPRDKVLVEFSAGTIGLAWILRYFLSWFRFKLKKKA